RWRFNHPNTWVNSGGLGTMGFAVPASIGAKVGKPDRMVWAIDGDGCFQMTAQELVTASAERIPVKIAILNNAYLGMVRQWQEMFYEERYSEVYLSPDLPDYVKWAEAMGCAGFRVEHPEDVQPTIDKANGIDDRPVVIDFRTDEQITKQLFKLINVVKISELAPSESVERELLMCTAKAGPDTRGQIIELVQIFEGRIIDVGHERLTVMLAGAPAKLDDFEELL